MRARDENKEQSIRTKAIEMIVNEGLEGFSMQKLAKAAAVSPATLYIYYRDKEDLLKCLSAVVFNKMMDFSLRNFHPEMTFEEGMRVQWKNRATYFIENPVEVQFIELLRHSPLFNNIYDWIKSSFRETMSEFVNNAIERKELIKLPFEAYWSMAFAPLYQLMQFHTLGQSYASKKFELNEDIMEQTLQLVLKALRP